MGKVLYYLDDCTVDFSNREILKNDVRISLDNQKWQMLEALVNAKLKKRILTPDMIVQAMAYSPADIRPADDGDRKNIKNIVAKLRSATSIKIGNKSGAGYYLENMPEVRKISGLHSHISHCSDIFFGRENVLNEIHDAFSAGNNVVFLKGMGGIGKSETARWYAHQFADSYDTVVFAGYAGSLAELISNDDVFFVDDIFRPQGMQVTDYKYACEKIKEIKASSDERTLIIIDNYDTYGTDEFLAQLVSDAKYRVLFTTRYDQEPKYKQIPVEEIQDDDALKKIVISYCNPEYMTVDYDDPYFPELFRLTCRHTLTLELISLYMSENSYDVGQMVEILKAAGFEALSDRKLTHDDKNKTAFAFIKEIFRMTSLSEEEKSFLRHLALTADAGVPHDAFKEWNGRLFNISKAPLIRKRLVKYDPQTKLLILHPIVREVVMSDLKPSYDNCIDFIAAYIADINDLKFQNFSSVKKKACAECGKKMYAVMGLSRQTFMLFHEAGKTLYQSCGGNAKEVIDYRLKLHEFAVEEYGENSIEACMTAIQAGNAYLIVGDIDKALYFQQEKAYRILVNTDSSHELFWDLSERCLDQLGNIYFKRYRNSKDDKDYTLSETYFMKGFEATESMYETDTLSRELICYKSATPVVGLCNLYFEKGNAEALKVHIEKLSAVFAKMQELGFNMEFDMVLVTFMYGKYYYLNKEYEAAADMFRKAIKSRREYADVPSATLMEAYICIADCYLKTDLKEMALECLYNALHIAEKLYVPGYQLVDKIKNSVSELELRVLSIH